MCGLLPLFSHSFSSVFWGSVSEDLCGSFIIGQANSLGEIAANNPPYILGQYPKSASLWVATKDGKHSERSVDSIENCIHRASF